MKGKRMKTKYTFTPLENMPGKDMNACRSLLPMDAAKWERMSERLQKYFVVVPGDEPEPIKVAPVVVPVVPASLPVHTKRTRKAKVKK
jgi:hypothetical protein